MSYPTSIRRVIIIPLENTSRSSWIANPFIGNLAKTYGDATNFHGFSGISLPDYLMETSGSNQGITGDSFSFCQFKINNIYDVLTANGLTFENFEEKTGSQGNHRHTPGYLYPSTCKGVQDMTVFMSKYVNGGQVPTAYTWVTANFCNIGHDCPVSTASTWLQNTLKLNTILSKPWFTDGSTLVILVCDDGGSAGTPTLCLTMSTSSKGTKSNVSYKHTNVLSTVMWALGIPGSIANSSAGTAMKDLFGSTPPPPTQLTVSATVSPTTLTLGQTATFTVLASGGKTPYNYSWKGLPTPLAGSNVNIVTGIPDTPGTYSTSITVTDSSSPVQTATATGTLVVNKIPPPTGNIVVTTPTAGLIYLKGESRVVRWTHATGTGANVKIELLKASVVVKTISSNTSNDGAFAWTVPSVTSGNDYQVRITDLSNAQNTGVSGNFTIN